MVGDACPFLMFPFMWRCHIFNFYLLFSHPKGKEWSNLRQEFGENKLGMLSSALLLSWVQAACRLVMFFSAPSSVNLTSSLIFIDTYSIPGTVLVLRI